MNNTKVVLKPLQDAEQLEEIGVSSYAEHVWNDDGTLFTVTFDLGNGFMQDMAIVFTEGSPKAYISDAYTWNNGDLEITDNLATETFRKLITDRKAMLKNMPPFLEKERAALNMEIESYKNSIRAIKGGAVNED